MESAWTTPEVQAVLALLLASPARNCGDAGTRCFEHNAARAAEYRTASLSPGRWKRELRSTSRTVSMSIAELQARMEELEDVLGVSLSY